MPILTDPRHRQIALELSVASALVAASLLIAFATFLSVGVPQEVLHRAMLSGAVLFVVMLALAARRSWRRIRAAVDASPKGVDVRLPAWLFPALLASLLADVASVRALVSGRGPLGMLLAMASLAVVLGVVSRLRKRAQADAA